MPRKATAVPANGLPGGLAQPAVRALRSAGYSSLEQLAGATEVELRKLHGMGPHAMLQAKAGLAQCRPLAGQDDGRMGQAWQATLLAALRTAC